jgi:hypothetical protein
VDQAGDQVAVAAPDLAVHRATDKIVQLLPVQIAMDGYHGRPDSDDFSFTEGFSFFIVELYRFRIRFHLHLTYTVFPPAISIQGLSSMKDTTNKTK